MTTEMNLPVITVALSVMAILGATSLAATFGSMSAIDRSWHDERIYSVCIRPLVKRVVDLPTMVGALLGALLWLYLAKQGWAPVPSAALGCLAGGTMSFFWARSRGRRIYAEAIRRAGFY
jgi:hypothetical protein